LAKWRKFIGGGFLMNKSESIAKISKALAQFQGEVKNPANTETNPFFNSKYAPLSDILNAVRPLLSKYGLSVLQSPSGDGQNIAITTLIVHESGEWIESDPLTLKAEKATAQGAGSAITYARRYALSAMLGISSEDDNDGNAVIENSKPESEKNEDMATEAQLKKLYAMAKIKNISSDEMKKIIYEYYGKESSKELSKKEASDLIKRITEFTVEQ